MKAAHSSFNECDINRMDLTKIEEHQNCDNFKLCRIFMLCLFW